MKRSKTDLRLLQTDRVLQTNTTIQYQYCEDGNGAFQKNVNSCMDCLSKVPSSNTLVNYLRALDQACDQKPPIGGSTPIKLDFDLYNTTAPPSATHASPAAVTVTSSSDSSTHTSSSPSNSHSVALGAGLGLGLGIPLLCLLGLLIYLYRRQHAQRQHSLSEMEHLPPENPRSQNNPTWRAEMHGSASLPNYHEVDNNNKNDVNNPPAVPEKDHWNPATKTATSPERTSKSELSSRPSRGGSVQELTGSSAAMHEMPSHGSLRATHPASGSPREAKGEERRIGKEATTAGNKTTVGSWGWRGTQ